MKDNLKKTIFIIALLFFFMLFDYGASVWGENYCRWTSGDFEVTKQDHPEKVWEKVFFGNSSVIAAYREDVSESGYVNFGMDYAVVTDLLKILKQGHAEIGSDLVIGLNLFTLYDDFDTNPSYIWHRGVLEPYSYFHRDKLLQMMKDSAKALIGRDVPEYAKGEKIVYYGNLSDEVLADKMIGYNERYFNLPMKDFSENIAALEDIADFCLDKGIRLRIIWMPFNPSVEKPELLEDLKSKVNGIANDREIDVLDLTDSFDESCFHDVGHLNYEHGAYIFTGEADKWLKN